MLKSYLYLIITICIFVILFSCNHPLQLKIEPINDSNDKEILSGFKVVEPAVCIHPTDNTKIVVASINNGKLMHDEDGYIYVNQGCIYSFTTNSGSTWVSHNIKAEELNRGFFSDPSVTISENGDIYIAGYYHNYTDGSISDIIPVIIKVDGQNPDIYSVFPFREQSDWLFDKPWIILSKNKNNVEQLTLTYTGVNPSDQFERYLKVIMLPTNSEFFTDPETNPQRAARLPANTIMEGNNWGAHLAKAVNDDIYLTWNNYKVVMNRTVNTTVMYSKYDKERDRWGHRKEVVSLGNVNSIERVLRAPWYPVIGAASSDIYKNWVYLCFNDSGRNFSKIYKPKTNHINTLGINNKNKVAGWYAEESEPGIIKGFIRDEYGTFSELIYEGAVKTASRDINLNNVITGVYKLSEGGADTSFIWKNGQFSTVNYPESSETSVFGINDDEYIVGSYKLENDTVYGFLRTAEGDYETLQFPNALHTKAMDINNDGVIVGNFYDDDIRRHGFIRDAQGDWDTIDYPGAISTSIGGINDEGHIAGSYTDIYNASHGFIKIDNEFIPIDFPAARGTYLSGINSNDKAIGYYISEGYPVPFVVNGYLDNSDRDIWLVRSDNKGDTWSLPFRVNEEKSENQFFPSMTVLHGGAVFFCWLDQKRYPDHTGYDVYGTASALGSMDFFDNIRMSTQKSGLSNTGSVFIGDYISGDACDDYSFFVWTDLRDNNAIYGSKLKIVQEE